MFLIGSLNIKNQCYYLFIGYFEFLRVKESYIGYFISRLFWSLMVKLWVNDLSLNVFISKTQNPRFPGSYAHDDINDDDIITRKI